MWAAVAVIAYAAYRFSASDTTREEVENDFVVIDNVSYSDTSETLRRFVFLFSHPLPSSSSCPLCSSFSYTKKELLSLYFFLLCHYGVGLFYYTSVLSISTPSYQLSGSRKSWSDVILQIWCHLLSSSSPLLLLFSSSSSPLPSFLLLFFSF